MRKPDEKNEELLLRKLRLFQKQDIENKRCADCNDIGPTYVCMNFGTFICTTCSGLHREVNHKVKGVSVSKWTNEDIDFILNHGNTKAKETFLKKFKNEIIPPEANQLDLLRNWIRYKYIEKRWVEKSNSNKDVRRVDQHKKKPKQHLDHNLQYPTLLSDIKNNNTTQPELLSGIDFSNTFNTNQSKILNDPCATPQTSSLNYPIHKSNDLLGLSISTIKRQSPPVQQNTSLKITDFPDPFSIPNCFSDNDPFATIDCKDQFGFQMSPNNNISKEHLISGNPNQTSTPTSCNGPISRLPQPLDLNSLSHFNGLQHSEHQATTTPNLFHDVSYTQQTNYIGSHTSDPATTITLTPQKFEASSSTLTDLHFEQPATQIGKTLAQNLLSKQRYQGDPFSHIILDTFQDQQLSSTSDSCPKDIPHSIPLPHFNATETPKEKGIEQSTIATEILTTQMNALAQAIYHTHITPTDITLQDTNYFGKNDSIKQNDTMAQNVSNSSCAHNKDEFSIHICETIPKLSSHNLNQTSQMTHKNPMLDSHDYSFNPFNPIQPVSTTTPLVTSHNYVWDMDIQPSLPNTTTTTPIQLLSSSPIQPNSPVLNSMKTSGLYQDPQKSEEFQWADFDSVPPFAENCIGSSSSLNTGSAGNKNNPFGIL